MTYTLANYFEEAMIDTIPDWFGSVSIVHPDWRTPMKPRWHQITGLNLLFTGTRAALYDEQGTGKTLVAAAYCAWQGAVDNGAVVLMPPVLLGQFKAAILDGFPGIEKHLRVEIYAGTIKQRQKLLDRWVESSWPHVVLMTYDMFRQEGFKLFEHYDCLVMDEAKVLGNVESQTYTAIERFMGKPGDKYGLAMNGTPARKDLTDLYGYIHFTSPEAYVSRLHFDTKHVVYKKIPVRVSAEKIRDVKVVDHFQNIDELFNNLYLRARRVIKKEVMDLPDKNIIPFRVELSDKHLKVYRKFVDERLLIFDDNSIIDGTTTAQLRSIAMRAVVDPTVLNLDCESAVLDAIEEIADETDLSKTKLFVVAHYQRTVELIAERMKQFNPAVIYGGSSNNERQKEKFLKDDTCRVCVANYLSGGVGLNFQGVAYTGIAVEPTVPGDFDQATDRLHRSGQEHGVNFYVLMVQNTVFMQGMHNMAKRKAINESVVSKTQLEAELLGVMSFEEVAPEASASGTTL